MDKVKMNYLLDSVIALAFLVSVLTGVVFLFAGDGGYQGGANAGFQTAILGISRWIWSDLHTWASLVMTAGVGLHVVFHWKWIVCVTKKMLPKPAPKKVIKQTQGESCPVL
ncbi:MAG: DUF4405 domain-containing protein [Anaerolineae bacterium]|nr:DUF4405 domain-containing protein [Anaerolineae bacterium]